MSRRTMILIAFMLTVAAILALSQFLQNQAALTLTVAVNPMAEDWMRGVAADFNDGSFFVNGTTRIQVRLTRASDVAVWEGELGWNRSEHPDAWLPAATLSLGYLDSRMPFKLAVDSLARTPLVWGGFDSRVRLLSADGSLDWDVIADAVRRDGGNWASLGGEDSWGFLKLAYPSPSDDVAGLAVLFSGASDFTASKALERQALLAEDFNDWMDPIVASVPNFQTLGSDPAESMASRGASVAEIALLPEVLWLTNLEGFAQDDPLRLSYPATQVSLDFPFAVWDDANTDEHVKSAAKVFADYVAGSGQNTVTAFGLRPAKREPTEADAVFARGAAAGIRLEPDYGRLVDMPDRNTAETLLQRFG